MDAFPGNPAGSMEVGMKSNAVMEYEFDADLRLMRWKFKTAGTLEFPIRAKLEAESANDYAALQAGYKQKIGDCAAISRNPDTGASATEGDKFAAMREMIEHLNANVGWNRTGGGKKVVVKEDLTDLVAAVCAAYGKQNSAAILALLESKSAAERDQFRAQPKVLAAMAKILKDRAKTTGEVAKGLEAELDAIEGSAA